MFKYGFDKGSSILRTFRLSMLPSNSIVTVAVIMVSPGCLPVYANRIDTCHLSYINFLTRIISRNTTILWEKF